MISVDFSMFLDRAKVIAAVENKRLKVFLRLGGFTMQVMRRSMRYSKKISEPGKPPHARRNNPQLREKTFFGYETSTDTLVVGPTIYRSKTKPASGKTVPQLLNEGGRADVVTPRGVVKADYRPRPFVAPAQEIGNEKFAELLEKTPL
jgi:hypothetical protein